MSKAIGIDLGTTNSCVAVVEVGETKVIQNSEGFNTTPSIVAFNDKNERLIGQLAKRQVTTNPKKTIYSVKRLIGNSFDSPVVQEDIKRLGYEVSKGVNNTVQLNIGKKKFSPIEISAFILQKMKSTAEDYLREKVTQAVITVPAYFDDNQRQATKDAGKIAGLEVLRIINEPTAAALFYGLDKKKKETIIVFDLGGGTFDVSVLELRKKVFEVLATNGDTHLGGDDFDLRIINYLTEEFKKENNIDLSQDKQTLQRLKEEAEKIKQELSSATESEVNIPFITSDVSGPKHLNTKITRAKFEQLVDDLIQKSLDLVKKTLKNADLEISDIDDVILVGGMTRMPKISEELEKLIGKTPNKSVKPDEVVALGAAIQGNILAMGDLDNNSKGMLQENFTGIALVDVTPLSLGTDVEGGIMQKLIERNTTIPVNKSEIFTTTSDNQSSVSIQVLQGERKMSADNKMIGNFGLSGIAPAQRGVPQIEVTFDIDANGILNVSAKDKSTKKEQKISITGSGGLSDKDIQRMIEDAEQYAKTDKEKKELADAKNEADRILYEYKKILKENEEKINNGDKQKIETSLQELESKMEGENILEIKKAIEDLNTNFHKIR